MKITSVATRQLTHQVSENSHLRVANLDILEK